MEEIKRKRGRPKGSKKKTIDEEIGTDEPEEIENPKDPELDIY